MSNDATDLDDLLAGLCGDEDEETSQRKHRAWLAKYKKERLLKRGRDKAKHMANPLPVGTVVRFTTSYKLPFTHGVIVEHVPEKEGYMVRPEGEDQGYGWGYCEFEVEPRPTCWERLK